MHILLLTNEYPPHIYGGAGVHVEHLTQELVRLESPRIELTILSFGDQAEQAPRRAVSGIGGPDRRLQELQHAKLLDALYRNLAMVGMARGADLIHCHTWYSYLAGCLLKQILSVPLVATLHSLEPHRPWKREQLGSAYNATLWLEKTALESADGIIAVSTAMKADAADLYDVAPERIRIIYNGIDSDRFHKIQRPDTVQAYGIDPGRPYVLFVGRITRQKGILHLVRALPQLDPGVQVVLCAGAPDTAEIGREMEARVRRAREETDNDVIWVRKMVPVPDLIALYSHAAVFVCPSVYEPFGIINLEAMACGTPVVGAAVGGIPEIVVPDRTGLLVPLEPAGGGNPEPRDPDRYAADLAAAVNALLRHPEKRAAMAKASRERVEAHFAWSRIASQTVDFYRDLLSSTALK